MRFAYVLCCSVAILVVTKIGATEPGNRLYGDSVSAPQKELHHRFRRHPVLGVLQLSLGDDKKSKSAARHSKHRKGKDRKKKPNDQGLLTDVLSTKPIVIIGGDEGKEDESSKELHNDTSLNKNLKSHGRAAEKQNLSASSTDSVRQASNVSPKTIAPPQEPSKMTAVTRVLSLETTAKPEMVSTAEGSNSTVAPLQESSTIAVTIQVVSLETTAAPDTASSAEGSNSTVARSQESSTIPVATEVVTAATPDSASTSEVSTLAVVSAQESSKIGGTIQVASFGTTATLDVASTSEISDSTVVQPQESSAVGVTTQVVSLESTASPDAVSTTQGSNATASESDDLNGSQTLTKSGSRSIGRADGGSLSVAAAGTGSRYLTGDDLAFLQNFGGKTFDKFNQNGHSHVLYLAENVSPQSPSAFPDLKQEWSLPKQPIDSQSRDSIQRKYSNIQTISSQQSHPLWQDLRNQDNSFVTPERKSAYDSYVQMLRQAFDPSQGHSAFLGESLNHKPMFSPSTQDSLYQPPDLDSLQNYQSPSHLSPNTSPFHHVVHHKQTYDVEDPFFA